MLSVPGKDDMIYAVFTTPVNSITGSAVCAYKMKHIIHTFNGTYKDQETMNSNWLPVPPYRVSLLNIHLNLLQNKILF